MSFELNKAFQIRDVLLDRINVNFTIGDLTLLCEVAEHIIKLGDRSGYFLYKAIAEIAYKKVGERKMNVADINATYQIYINAITKAGREDFESFCIAMDANLEVNQRFYEPRKYAFKEIAEHLQKLEDGVYEFLSISCPPRVGKTRIATYYLVWTSARHPLESNLATSYSDTITVKFHKDALTLMVDPQYRFAEIFPEIIVKKSYAKEEAIDLNEIRSYHTITCRSVGGSVTGVVECTNLLYCDDLVSGQEEALSFDRMQKLWGEFTPNILSRKKMGCKILCVATRWSVHDPIGQFENMYEGKDGAKFFVKPALDENEESNFDFPFGLGFDTKFYRELLDTYMKKDDEITWLCLYQNEPIERKGLAFAPDSLKYYNGELPSGEPDGIYSAVDVAWGGGDYVSAPVGFRYGDDVYIADVVFSNEDKTVTKPSCTACMVKNKVQIAEFEANNGGDEFAEDVDAAVKKAGHRMLVRTQKAPSNMAKLTRIMQFAPDIKSFYFLSVDSPKRTVEYNNFMRQLTTFTITGKNKNDDAPDSLARLASIIFGTVQTAEVKVLRRTF